MWFAFTLTALAGDENKSAVEQMVASQEQSIEKIDAILAALDARDTAEPPVSLQPVCAPGDKDCKDAVKALPEPPKEEEKSDAKP